MEKRNTTWKQHSIKPNVTHNQKNPQAITWETPRGYWTSTGRQSGGFSRRQRPMEAGRRRAVLPQASLLPSREQKAHVMTTAKLI